MSDQRQCILLNYFKTLTVGPAGNWTRAWHSLVSYLTSGANQSVPGRTVQLKYHIKKHYFPIFSYPAWQAQKGQGEGQKTSKRETKPPPFSPPPFSACFFPSCINTSKLSLQSNQVKRTPQEAINESIIQKLNPLLVVDFRLISSFLNV